MKGIVLAGGKGTRLYPSTKVVSKQLLPIYNKPMILYPLATLIDAGIKEILIITTPKDKSLFINLLGNGEEYNCKIEYAVQNTPNGIAEAFIIGEEFIGNDFITLILGDNIFHGEEFMSLLKQKISIKQPTIFGVQVEDPNRYGVVKLDINNRLEAVIEKPDFYVSDIAVPGIYIYDSKVIDVAKSIKKSSRGEKEITDIHNHYINNNNLEFVLVPDHTKWFDSGTHDSLLEASNFMKQKSNNK